MSLGESARCEPNRLPFPWIDLPARGGFLPKFGEFAVGPKYDSFMSTHPMNLVSVGHACGRFNISVDEVLDYLAEHNIKPVLTINGMSLFESSIMERAVSAICWPGLSAGAPLIHGEPTGPVEFVENDPPDDEQDDDGDEPDEPEPIFRNGLNLSDLLGVRNHE